MFDLTSSKLFILAVVALLVVGPKDLPALLRTIGKYVGMIRRQANEFRAQFDEAMRESELAELKKEVETLGQDARDTFRDASQTVQSQVGDIDRDLKQTMAETERQIDPAAPPPEDQVVPAATNPDSAPAGASQPEAGSLPEPGAQPGEALPFPVAPPAAQPRAMAAARDTTAAGGG